MRKRCFPSGHEASPITPWVRRYSSLDCGRAEATDTLRAYHKFSACLPKICSGFGIKTCAGQEPAAGRVKGNLAVCRRRSSASGARVAAPATDEVLPGADE